MNRRSYLKATLAAAAAVGVKDAAAQPVKNPIVLHVDLSVDPAKEKEMQRIFHTQFKPAAEKHPGYIDVKVLKLRQALQGPAPAGVNYRFELTYASEELRQKWITSDIHKKLWPTMEATLRSKDYGILLFDSV